MTPDPYDGTIDWTEYWATADESDRDAASGSKQYLLEPLDEFFGKRGVPDSDADVGCGPGAAVFRTARRYPETTVVGYDAAEPVLEENRRRARQNEDANVSFERTVLPAFDPGRQFDVVSSLYTLCYVTDVERALQTLYDAVAPGGYLLFTYHNEYAQSVFESIAESPHDYLDESSAWDPDHFAERFELVIDGENLLSYRLIRDVLGSWPQSVWSVAESAERYRAWRQNPFAFVPK